MKFEDLLTPKPYRWPKKGDLPFRKAMTVEAAGNLAADGPSRTVFIMEGFMQAGKAIADLILDKRASRFEMVYPMLFCYRHAVETGLKWLIIQYGPHVGVTPPDLNDTHNLLELWRHFAKINKACGAEMHDEELLAVGKIIKQFHDWDRHGVAFRYATNKRGTVISLLHSDVDIENLKDVMNGVSNFLNGSDGWLASVVNAQRSVARS
ncbi:hypothetical protein [Methylosinus sp. KRF6]|uniref:hypothetical protein n=1 Tax=Methylosinus sp. KRF6 TaxID=2846853 RepID=UPI001C0BDFED|nr:hypothetical protein [Methylosinus sp. KRF6]MBU3891080.1 hypothetical protein [Methylosinus sp. KRF6]